MKMKKMLIVLLVLFCSFNMFSQEILKTVGEQLIKKDKIFAGRFPIYTENGKWIFSKQPNWFSGFTAGELWYMFELTGDEQYKKRAIIHADSLIKYSTLDNTHDMGFIFFNSCVKAYQHTGVKKYKDAAIQAAYSLAKRFNKNGNYLRAWGKLGSDDRDGWTIIDTMMNLELLFWAAKETGDFSLYDVAYKHAIICMNEHVRKNYSSYHVVQFDPTTGKVKAKHTHQGFADESTWARGQAWGIYGFALAYKYTQDERFFNISKKMAEYFLERLPTDLIPTWDLDLLNKTEIRDASAAAIAASGMYLIAELTTEKENFIHYLNKAKEITKSLKANYLFTNSKRENEEGILLQTVYNFAKKWGISESFPCGDFYFIECIKKEIEQNKKEMLIENSEKRQSILINADWFYLEDGLKSISDLHLSTKNWEKVSLPHTWNKTDALDSEPGYRRDIGWYQKDLFIPMVQNDMVYKLHFEGVNNKSEVYVNGKYAGGFIGGYVGFEVDITKYIKLGEMNFIVVKADNSFDPYVIPSQKSDFVVYGGITRNVWINILPKTHIQKVFVQTPTVSAKSAVTKINANIHSNETKKYTLIAKLLNKEGKVVLKDDEKFTVTKGQSTYEMQLPELKKPNLWSPDTPYLYTLEILIIEDGKETDRVTEKVGYRWYEFKEKGAFYLNGKRLLLRGTHRHEELSGYGNALPDTIHRKDVKLIKDLGANFVRLAHYPQALEVYKACDELGLLVWDENPWCRGGMGPKEWQTNTQNIFEKMILQNYNHPSIIMWSIGNESDWLPDFAGGDNQDSLKVYAQKLHNLAKKLDPYRVTTTRKFPAAQNVVDVFSPSIWSGWYSDVYKNYEKALIKARDANKSFFHAEFGGDSHVGRHTETPISGEGKIQTIGGDEPINKIRSSSIANIGDWSESYIVDLFDWYLHVTENLDWLTGSAQWIFRDFTTPLRPENPIPYVNQKGLVDMNNKPKDAYYVFKSYWSESPKFAYIESHTWLKRNGEPNQKREVNVFSNCNEVELFINNVSQGKLKRNTKSFPAAGLSWQVLFIEGKNNIQAIGYDDSKLVAQDSLSLEYTTKKIGKPEELILSKERCSDGSHLITAQAVDNMGNLCTDFNQRVYFTALSGGKLIDNLGTPTGSSIIELANGKAQIKFKHIPFQKGVIEVRNQDFKGTFIVIED